VNLTLIDKIVAVERGILVTILTTEGHTYKKSGDKALYEVGELLPVYGNIGAGCVDQEILERGKSAFDERRPATVRIDTSEPSDIVFGYGTYCGGVIEVLLEPVFEAHKRVYRELRERLCRALNQPDEEGAVYLIHDLRSGDVSVSGKDPHPSPETHFVEKFLPAVNLYLFGATPLAHCLVKCLSDMEFQIHVVDWRPAYLEKFEGLGHVRLHGELGSIAAGSLFLVISHYYERDRDALRRAIAAECPFVGMLSSKMRRDRMFEELRRDGVPVAVLDRISSPVGIDISARSDPEIAVSIVAELVAFRNRSQ
jgi:xanthine dehydrogenase accessory factor